MGSAPRIIATRACTPRDPTVQDSFEDFGSQHPDVELCRRSARLFEGSSGSCIHQAWRKHRSTLLMDWPVSWLKLSPEVYTHMCVCFYTWPAASTPLWLPVPPSCGITQSICPRLGFREGAPTPRAHCHDHGGHLSGGCEATTTAHRQRIACMPHCDYVGAGSTAVDSL